MMYSLHKTCWIGAILFAFLSPSVSHGQALVVNRQPWGGSTGTDIERVLLLLPGGPVVLQSTIFLDGQPQRDVREKLIDGVLKQADTDGDGKSTWKEALDNPRFSFAVTRFAGGNAQQQEQIRNALLKQLDQNSDGVVDRPEAHLMLARSGGGGGFAVNGGFNFNRGGGRTDLQTLLDTDRDLALSTGEIAATPERLKSRDANDNDLLEPLELDAGNIAAQPGVAAISHVLPLGPSADWRAIRAALLARYGADGKITAAGMPLFPRLLDGLDRNANGLLDPEEDAGFNSIRPQVAITVRFKTTDQAPAEADATGVAVTWLAPEFTDREPLDTLQDAVTLKLPGVLFTITVPTGPPPANTNFRRSAEVMLANFDTDKNGYLEKAELEKVANAQYAVQQFDRWDENGDGKVYVAEIEADYERQQAPQRSQVNLIAADLGTGLFSQLDLSGDNRLSAREMRAATDRLQKLDHNADGRLAGDELPTEFRVTLSPANRAGYNLPQMNAANAGRNSSTPKWFIHMDRNDDGDVTLKEFLGTPEKFRELDRNDDGFLEPAEAIAAQPK